MSRKGEMMMKQIAAWILAWMLVFTLTGCGGKDASDEPAQEETLQTEEADSAKQPDNGSLTVVSDGLEETAEQGETLRGGTNQNDAVLLPLNTRLTGKATQEGGLWYAFTTGSAENATYKITAVNKTLGTGNLDLRVYDAYGKTIHDPYGSPLQATQVGRASTLSLELPPDTTYYIYIWSEKEDSIEYSLIIRDPEEQKTGYSTAGSVSEAVGAVAGQEISAGTNQDDGGMIPLEAQLSGKVSNNLGQWFAFTTNSVENATYEITTVNITPGTGNLDLRVYDVYGSTMHDPYGAPLQAAQDGKAATLSLELPPNTTYYIYIWADKGDSIQYTLRIHGPEEPTAESGTATVEQEPLVFETPFELNSTQVMFKAESDAFINE